MIGGGPVGQRKVAKLLTVQAQVRLISPVVTEQLERWAEQGRIEWLARPYQHGDLASAKLVFAATNQRTVNAQVVQEATTRGLLCNVADNPAEGNFHVPAVYRGETVLLTVSTSGQSPGLARRTRDRVAEWLTEAGIE